jgi:sterol desaturase/sphingolipid hydroxylase (fatty acid hydroxylase superfamily)
VAPVRLLLPPTAVYLPLIVVLAITGASPALSALGFVLWTLGEYLVHRFVQHAPLRRRWMPDDHDYHHQVPEDPIELVYALRHSLAAALPIGLVTLGVTRSLDITAALLAGVLAGYLAYEWLHLCSHRPQLVLGHRLLQRLVRNHRRHHDEGGRLHFGFVTPFWDIVFRTR